MSRSFRRCTYLGWVVNRGELLDAAAAAGLVLEREFLAPGTIDAAGAPEPAHLHSFLFRRIAQFLFRRIAQ